MQIVADAGAIVCGVVVTEDLEGRVFHAPDGHVSEEWEEVTRSSFWFLPDESRGVCPSWAVKVYAIRNQGKPRESEMGAYLKYRSEMHFQVPGFAAKGLRDTFGRDRRRRTAAVVVEDRLSHDL